MCRPQDSNGQTSRRWAILVVPIMVAMFAACKQQERPTEGETFSASSAATIVEDTAGKASGSTQLDEPGAGGSEPTVGTTEVSEPLLIIDTSRDMEGPEGLDACGGQWPAIHYLAGGLGVSDCVGWENWEGASRTECDRFSATDLTWTSPLTAVIGKAVQGHKTDLFFLTNGLDWQVEGRDSQFMTEMDVGAELCGWLANSEHDVVLGLVQETHEARRRFGDRCGTSTKDHSHHRPLMLVGLITRLSDMQCYLQPANVPGRFQIRVARVSNPRRTLLRDGVLTMHATVRVGVSDGMSQAFAVEQGGLVRLGDGLRDELAAKAGVLTFNIIAKDPSQCNGRITATLPDSTEISGICQPSALGAECSMNLPALPALRRGQSVALRFSVRAGISNEFDDVETSKAFDQTVATLLACGQPAQLASNDLADKPFSVLTLTR